MAGFAADRCRMVLQRQMCRWLLPVAVLLSCLATAPAHAQVGSARYASIVVDSGTGDVLEEVNADEPRHPASLTKMMTLYLTFEALRDRRITMDQPVPVSAHAASMEPSKLGLVPGMQMTVEQAILGLVTKSANDAAAALGELLGGSEDRFAQMMTLRARALGMNHTTFENASGLPDPDQWTTARDLAMLSRHLISDFPSFYGYFSTPSFVFHRQVIFNHDSMLRSYPGADGLKTGYTDASGHNLVTSAVRGGVRLVGVVLGAGSNAERNIHMTALLDHAFEQMDVPISNRPVVVASSRMNLIASAHAAEIARATPVIHTLRPRTVAARWNVRVTSFASERAARPAVLVRHGGEARVEPAVSHRKVWRPATSGLRVSEAQEACSPRARHKGTCGGRSETRVVASR